LIQIGSMKYQYCSGKLILGRRSLQGRGRQKVGVKGRGLVTIWVSQGCKIIKIQPVQFVVKISVIRRQDKIKNCCSHVQLKLDKISIKLWIVVFFAP
jgi:hypothetical protein